jgi:thiosulfate/3-mercaptopyruvate sulfurtransferase
MDVAYAAASGHIPGSVRVTGLGFLADGEHWRTPEECRSRIEQAGVADAPRTILYCGGGVAATGALLGWRLAGFEEGVSVYDGSWGEWEQDPDAPKEPH